MHDINFPRAFADLTGNQPFPWQQELYEHWFSQGKFPDACILPTGLGKTSVVPIWLIAFAKAPDRVPRRLVYVVNRRTVVDQTTTEAENVRKRADAAGVPRPAISTLRGQFVDNREWSADPSRPAIIVGTVDMIGSRLLFSGYGIGFKSRPLHAGLLGQDVLIVHDEAHLEPAFQELLLAIQKEQHEGEQASALPWPRLRVMEMTATSRGSGTIFTLSDRDRADPEVQRRIGARKAIQPHKNNDDKKLAEEIAGLALKHEGTGLAVLVFVRKVDDVEKIVNRLPGERTRQLTGTIRGWERDELVRTPIFQRFLPEWNRDPAITPAQGTVYLVCTSAGEVGVNISADHLVCDLSTFDSMAQRFGRVNRFGLRQDTQIDVVYPASFDEADDLQARLKRTLELLQQANGDGSPASLGQLHRKAVEEGTPPGSVAIDRARALREYILASYAPQPSILPVSEILLDAWAQTSITGKLPGRPMVEPYLHGLSAWEPPETHVAWREEVGIITGELLARHRPEELLEDYPLKPHELLRDISSRVFDRLKKLQASEHTPVWIVADDDSVNVLTLGELLKEGKESIEHKTIVLPPAAGGLTDGLLTDNPKPASDVADELRDAQGRFRRVRVWTDASDYQSKTENMRLIRQIDLPGGEDEDETGRSWRWFELPTAGDTDGSRSNSKPVLWQVHTDDVVNRAREFVSKLPLPEDLQRAILLSAKWHDLGKRRALFQRLLGNTDPNILLAKSGKQAPGIAETYRHEFGSLVDVQREAEFRQLSAELKDVVLHLIAAHHGRGRPHFRAEEVFDPEPNGMDVEALGVEVIQQYARLQRRFGRWGLAYLESLLRAADYAASASPSRFADDPAAGEVASPPREVENVFAGTGRQVQATIQVSVDPTNPGQFFACCGLLELADRLWPGAEGWFEGRSFQICCAGNLPDLIRDLRTASIVQLDPEDDTASPLEIGSPFRPLRLDWWQDERAGGKELKVWAGTMESVRIARAMQHALADERFLSPGLFDVGVIAYDPESPDKKVEPFYFDARRAPNAHSRDVGFSPNDLKMTTTAFPAVELLCLVGLQRCLPGKTRHPRVFDYFTWVQPVLPELLPLIVSGLFSAPGVRGYRFENWYRTGQRKHKAFRAAVPLSKGV